MAKVQAVREMMKEADQIKKKIDSGKLKGKALQAAKYRYYNLRYRANKKVKAETSKRKQLLSKQAFLPEFLSQMSMVRIEELVAEKVFNEVKKTLVVKTTRKAS